MREKRETEHGNYASNKELMAEFLKSKELGQMTNRFGELVTLIANRYARQHSWAQYSFREDMVSFAIMNLVANWHKFDPSKGSNLFSYYTTGVYRSFLYFIAKEKELANLRDLQRMEMGHNPTWNWDGAAMPWNPDADEQQFLLSSDVHAFSSMGVEQLWG